MTVTGSPILPALRAAMRALMIAAGAGGMPNAAQATQRGHLDVSFHMIPMLDVMTVPGEIDCELVLPEYQYGLMPFTIEGDRIKGMIDMPVGTGAKYIPPLPWRPPTAKPIRRSTSNMYADRARIAW